MSRHIELKERVEARIIVEMKEELVRLGESHAEEVRSLQEKVKRAEKY